MNYTEAVAGALQGLVDLPLEELLGLLETPRNAAMGDIAFPCFKLAKVMRKAPNAIAAELKSKYPTNFMRVTVAEVTGGGGKTYGCNIHVVIYG